MATMTTDDRFLLKLTAWRENRGGGAAGMQSVMNAILNRAAKRGESIYDICTDRLQFSSITALGDAETVLFAKQRNAADWQSWLLAEDLVAKAETGTLEDITAGAVDYYAPRGLTASETEGVFQLPTGISVPWPKNWDRAKVRFTKAIANQLFFAEV